MKKQSIQMIKDLSNAPGAPGFEEAVVQVVEKYAKGLGDFYVDKMKNAFVSQNTKKDLPVVQIDAHTDEVAFMVSAVLSNGMLKFIPLGGWVDSTVSAHEYLVRNTEGKYISAVVASKPPHFMSEQERKNPISMEQMILDVGGRSKEDVEENLKIAIGAPVVPKVECVYDEKRDLLIGKAFDCRIGCSALLDILKETKDLNLGVEVQATFSTQEEVGLRGAQVTANRVKPDVAIVFEGTPADDSFLEPPLSQTGLWKGPMLRHVDRAMITHPGFLKYAKDVAKGKKIAFQEAVRSGGATNGAAIHLSNEGVPVIVVAVPVRYIHTHYGLTSYYDYKETVDFGVALLKSLDKKAIDSL